MSVVERSFSTATHFIRKLRGSSQPVLVRADDGALYVAKFADNLQGGNLLFNEAMGAELYQACGLTVPSWKPLLLTSEFLDQQPGLWIESEKGLRRPSEGLCFGSRYVGSDEAQVYEILPAGSFPRICNREHFWLSWLIDICADHADNRQALFVEGADGRLLTYFIDHGHLFGGPGGNGKMHFTGSRYLDLRIYPQLSSKHLAVLVRVLASTDERAIRRRLLSVPDEWKTASALDRLENCLSRLVDRRLLGNLLETIGNSIAGRGDDDNLARRCGYRSQTVGLRAGVQPTVSF